MNPKSTAEHQAAGTFRDDRHGDRLDMEFQTKPPLKPEQLDDVASKVWDVVLAEMPSAALSSVDAFALEALCSWFSMWREAMQEARAGDSKEKHLAATRAAFAHKAFMSQATAFGLTPAARARIKLYAPAKPKPKTGKARLLKFA